MPFFIVAVTNGLAAERRHTREEEPGILHNAGSEVRHCCRGNAPNVGQFIAHGDFFSIRSAAWGPVSPAAPDSRAIVSAGQCRLGHTERLRRVWVRFVNAAPGESGFAFSTGQPRLGSYCKRLANASSPLGSFCKSAPTPKRVRFVRPAQTARLGLFCESRCDAETGSFCRLQGPAAQAASAEAL